MLKLTLFTTTEDCTELVKVKLCHASMFDKSNITFHCSNIEEQISLIKTLILKFVKFTVQGETVSIDMKEYQRVRIRIDST